MSENEKDDNPLIESQENVEQSDVQEEMQRVLDLSLIHI